MNPIKALFFDVDSTIYSHRVHDFPETTKMTLESLKAKGYKIGIATSRCRYETKNLPSFFREFDFDAMIYDGGALVMEHDKVLYKHPLAKEQIADLLSYAKEEGISIRYSTFDADCIEKECTWDIKDEFFNLYLNMPMIKPYEGEEVFNLLAYPKSKEHEAMIYKILHNSSIVKHSEKTIEITAKGIDKSIGVKKLASNWNIPMDNIVCFGDGANDIIMLQEAGLGIAMGNSHPKVKEAANRVCGHIDEDGIYLLCKELNLI